jgi:hypothetical protein
MLFHHRFNLLTGWIFVPILSCGQGESRRFRGGAHGEEEEAKASLRTRNKGPKGEQ